MTRTKRYWQNYLANQPSYGSYKDRIPEYRLVAYELFLMGLKNDMTIIDVGAGYGDFGRYLNESEDWKGSYVPLDGSIDGVDFNEWVPDSDLKADFVVSIETIEHIDNPSRLVDIFKDIATVGIVVTTPNPEVVDVLAVDPTHVYPVWADELSLWGAEVKETEFCGRGSALHGDTLVGVWDFRPQTIPGNGRIVVGPRFEVS